MHKTNLELETVTPMFLRGADNNKVELRSPPFKALFRYWWRTVQDCDVNTLRREEGKLFGSTDSKARLSLRISGKSKLKQTKYKLLPHKPDHDRFGKKMDAFDKEEKFELCMITKDVADTEYCKQVAKLGILLGGVGARSRRGFGSIRETCWDFKNICDLRDEVLKTLNTVAKTDRLTDRFQKNSSFNIMGGTVEIIESKWRTNNTSGSTIHHANRQYPVIRRIFFGKLTENLDGLLKEIGNKTSVAKAHNRDLTLGDGNPRMASPVVVRIQKIDSQYAPIVTQLYPVYPEINPHRDDIRKIPTDAPIKQLKFINDIIKLEIT